MDINETGVPSVPLVNNLTSSLLTSEVVEKGLNSTIASKYAVSLTELVISFTWFSYQFFAYFAMIMPSKLFLILSSTFHVTFSVYSLCFVLSIITTLAYTYIRYKYLTVYSRLPRDAKRQNPVIDTFVDSNPKEKRNEAKSYLDEFLSAIKIFGYLDSSVFHELTKSLQTQKLDSGEIIFLGELNGFTICVEGELQVYSKVNNEDQAKRSIFYKEDDRNVVIVDGARYQLLNIVKSGSPLSSIISVLDLFTDSGQTIASVTPTPYTIIDEHHALPLDGFSLDPLQQLPNARNESSVIPEMIAIPKGNCTISIIPKESFIKIAAKYPKDASHIIQMILAKLYRVTFQTAHNYLDLTPDIYQTEINVNINASKKISKLPKYLHDLAVSIINRDDELNNSDEQLNKVNRIINRTQNNLSNDVNEHKGRKIKNQRNRSFTDSNNYRASSASGSPSLMINTKSAPTKTNQPYFFNSDADADADAEADADADAEVDESIISSDNNNFSFSRPRLPKKKSRHIVLDSLSTNNPGDLFSNVPLPRGDCDMNLKLSASNIQKKELLNRTFTSDIDEDETEQSTLKIALAERISKMIGLDKNNFPLIQDSNQCLVSGPTINGIKSITADPQNNVSEKGSSSRRSLKEFSKLRTFSTNSMDSLNVDNDISSLHSPDINKTIINFEKFKYEFCNDIKLKKIAKGTSIVKTRETTPGLFYVIRGGLDVTYQKRENSYIDSYYSNSLQDTEKTSNMGFTDEYLHHVKEGEIAGYLGTLIGSKSFVDIKTSEDTYVAFLPREFFTFLSEKYPRVELSFANHLLKVLEKKLYFTDYSLEWMHQSAGNLLYVQGEPANGIYIVLNGRFRAITKPDNSKDEYQILGEFGQGESMGEIEVLTKSNRLSSVVAIRDGEIARIPRTLFELVAMTNPSIMVNVSRIVASRVNKDGILMANTFNSALAPATHIQDEPAVQNFNNYRTLTIMPTTYGAVPVEEFAEKLAVALEKVGKRVKLLNQSTVLTSLGRYAFDKLAKLKQSGFFSEIEEKYDIVIYLSDARSNSNWTQTCIQQGDCILLLANAQLSPDIGEYERLLVKTKTTARTELILLHPERYVEPGQTNKWLKNRIWVHSHHHVQMLCGQSLGDGIVKTRLHQFDALTILSKKFTENIKTFIEGNEFIQSQISFNNKKYYQPMQEHKNDFMRLARLLTGQAIGLVLGGGGARGISHVGVLKALEDQGIPVDIIGGTSIGAFVGGLYAKDYDFVPVYGRAKTFSSRMASIWRSFLDLTIPITSYITGHEFNRGIWKAFGDSRIEDFWITYYTNSTNLTQSVMEIHTSGYAWRYIRASMTLASLLPPMTDNGNMLMDGGYIDNLTVSEMERRGVRRIIACDVGSEDEKSLMQYGDSLSGFWVLFNRLNPFSSHPNVPTMADIQMKLAYVASVSALEKAKKTKGVVYLRPPIDGYATLDFGKFDEIYKVGLKYVNGNKDKISKVLIVKNERDKGFVTDTKRTRRYSM